MNLQEALDTFDRNGWLIVENLLTARQLETAKIAVQWALQQPGADHPWIRPRTYEWFREHPVFVELIEHPFVVEFAERWLGPDFHLIAAQCSRNTRDAFYAPGADQWHQDACFFPAPEHRVPSVPDDRYSFSAMWYLQDTPLEMGPTELTSRAQARDTPPANPTAAHRQAMPAGCLLLFNHRTWHRGAPNRTSEARDLITNAYALRAIDKVQLATRQPDGTQTYVPCQLLLDRASPTLTRLLAEPTPVGQTLVSVT